MKNSSNKFKFLKGFTIIDMGIIKGGTNAGCGNDADRLCFGWCPSGGCAHDGCCGSNYDANGDAACKSSGKETALEALIYLE